MAGHDRITAEGKRFFEQIEELKKLQVRVGYQRGEKTEEDGTDLVDIAVINEVGTDTIPARPFMRESVDNNKDAIGKIGEAVLKEVVQGGTAEQALEKIGDAQVGFISNTIWQYCKQKGPGWHLMTNAEWAAVALWCKKNGFMPKGNNNYGKDSTEGALPQRALGTYRNTDGTIYRTATGSGPASWYHDNTAAGIADLNGNVWEWNGGLRLVDGEIQIIPNNDAADWNNPLTPTSTLWRAIKPDGTLVAPGTAGTLKYGTSWSNTKFSSIVTTPAATGAGITLLESLGLIPHTGAASADYGDDAVWANITGERLPIRGGYWLDAASAGVFALSLSNARSNVHTCIGFRAAFCSL